MFDIASGILLAVAVLWMLGIVIIVTALTYGHWADKERKAERERRL